MGLVMDFFIWMSGTSPSAEMEMQKPLPKSSLGSSAANPSRSSAGGGEAASGGPNRNWKKVDDKYLKDALREQDTTPHELKREYLGKKAEIKKYDIYRDTVTGQLGIFDKFGNLVQTTYYYIK